MKAHPIIDYPYRWLPMLIVAVVLVIIQASMLCAYAGTNWFPALIDGIATIGWLAALAYLAWYVVGVISLFQTDIIMTVTGLALWLAGSFMVCDIMARVGGVEYISFATTLPFRLLFGVPTWIAVVLWYRLSALKDAISQDTELPVSPQKPTEPQPQEEEAIDRITVKDGSKIHLIKVEELICIQACGDYVTLTTPTGEYIKEQTMKYFETHLPNDNFVRVHRSTIANVTQISRVELFGKETYQLLLKNGMKLRVSLTGYRLLKERLGL